MARKSPPPVPAVSTQSYSQVSSWNWRPGGPSRAGQPLGSRGADAAAELAAVQTELDGLARAAADPQPLDPATLSELLAELRAQVAALA
ncbi:MAG TPA: hypothetical protein VH016_07845, partial [Actinomycetota bacterium]|nr:hypothetical protein [Actinomycetota bacterium]